MADAASDRVRSPRGWPLIREQLTLLSDYL